MHQEDLKESQKVVRVTIDKSAELPTGTYFYIIDIKTSSGNRISKDGYLYLTR